MGVEVYVKKHWGCDWNLEFSNRASWSARDSIHTPPPSHLHILLTPRFPRPSEDPFLPVINFETRGSHCFMTINRVLGSEDGRAGLALWFGQHGADHPQLACLTRPFVAAPLRLVPAGLFSNRLLITVLLLLRDGRTR